MAQQAQTWVLESDYHCGSATGLWSQSESFTRNPIQVELHKRRDDAIEWFGERPDVVVVNGDGTDGEDPKGRDVIDADPDHQAESVAINAADWNAKTEYIIVAGTRYHETSDGWPTGKRVCDKIKLICHARGQHKIKVSYARKLNTTINGWFRLQARHKIGRSVVPYGRNTSPVRSKVWSVLNAALQSAVRGKAARWPHLLLFSHVHYWLFQQSSWGAVAVTPCWQAIGSRYGDEECDGQIDLGCFKLTVGAKESDGWRLEHRVYPAGLVDRLERR